MKKLILLILLLSCKTPTRLDNSHKLCPLIVGEVFLKKSNIEEYNRNNSIYMFGVKALFVKDRGIVRVNLKGFVAPGQTSPNNFDQNIDAHCDTIYNNFILVKTIEFVRYGEKWQVEKK